jgi:hypothetical protein
MRDIWSDAKVDANEPLWRYFRATRFIDSVQLSTLHFAAATQFQDRFEGAVAIQPADFPIDPRYPELDTAERAFERLRRLTKLSCWHRADYESDAMWKLYAAAHKGVAIRTTAGRLRSALKPFRLAPTYGEEVPFLGDIRYADLLEVRLRVGMEERFFYKHRAFEWEHEFRVAISLRSAEEFGVNVPDLGIKVSFDPDALIQSVYLGPALAGSERDRIVAALEKVRLRPRLVVSSLLGRPRYV